MCCGGPSDPTGRCGGNPIGGERVDPPTDPRPCCGAIALSALTVGRCDRIIQRLLTDESLSKARRARSVLSLFCGYAVRDAAMPLNPGTRRAAPENAGEEDLCAHAGADHGHP